MQIQRCIEAEGQAPQRRLKPHLKFALWLSCLAVALLVIGRAFLLFHTTEAPTEAWIGLNELPGLSADALRAQGRIFQVQEPFLYHRDMKLATFVVQILSTNVFAG